MKTDTKPRNTRKENELVRTLQRLHGECQKQRKALELADLAAPRAEDLERWDELFKAECAAMELGDFLGKEIGPRKGRKGGDAPASPLREIVAAPGREHLAKAR